MNASKIEGAKAAAMAKVVAWAKVQSGAYHKKEAARAAGNTVRAKIYFTAECQASCRRARHEAAIEAMCRWEREAAEQTAWDAKVAQAAISKA